ncbi:MAG: hypothetical protein EOM43_14170, partial [Gammaproteobacteria bacterium]|nr:hypothetical protein [Gammaproteobacteria bacterium]
MITVFGRLLASFFDAQSEPVPVVGSVVFRPRFMTQIGEGALHLGTPATATLDSEGRFEIKLVDSPSSWQVDLNVKGRAGNRLRFPCFDFLPEPGVERINFADIVPLADPVTGVPMLRGEDGVGVSAITTVGGELIFTLTNGSETRIPVPQGIPGTGVDTITLQGDELVFALSDGSETRLPAPAGAPGKDAPKPNLAVGEVQTLPAGANATAEVTGESPDFVLSLGLPAGAKGDKGDTPTITAGTVSSLPAGASATAALTPTAGGYTLNLGLPAGAPGSDGKDAPTPTLAVGIVNTGTAAASITGTAPNFVLNLTLPAGAKGETGNPSTMALVGAGRPDTPATLSTANQTAVSSAPVGATFTSTNGAGTGAWAWVKTPTGWEPTYADTGWRDFTSLASLPANVSWATGFAGVFVRRQGGLLTVSIRGLTTTSRMSVIHLLTIPVGFRASKNATDMTSIPTLNDGGDGFTGKITFW